MSRRAAPRADPYIRRMAELTLLIIDDEPQIRRAVRHAVERDVASVLEEPS